MLYYAYQAQCDALAPMRLFAEAARDLLDQPWPGVGDLPLVRGAVAAMSLFSRTRLTHERRDFGIDRVTVDGAEIAVSEEAVAVHPFCRLVHFRKAAALDQPKLLMVAPLSGHFATLLRGTIATALPDHDVYLTDWVNARNVPVQHGRFGLDDEIELIIDFIRRIGPGIHVMAVCQPSVPVLAAVSLMAAANDPCQPRSMVLMGGPIDPEANPTEVNRFACSHSLAWFEHMVITTVPARYPGAFRRVYPGFLQLAGFLSMNPDRHIDAHWRMFRQLAAGDGDGAAATRAFYDEYSTVMDLPADFYLDTDGPRLSAAGSGAWQVPRARRAGRSRSDRRDRADDRRGRARRHLRARPDRRRARSVPQPRGGEEDPPPAAQCWPLRRLPRPPLAERDLSEGAGLHPAHG